MPAILAIVSKAVFEADARARGAEPGAVVPFDGYDSANKALSAAAGGALFLVTARPGDHLWLVGILEQPTFDGTRWSAGVNTTAIRDVTDAIPALRFATGKGLQPKPGALGMSLQTPRVLTDADEALLRGGAAPQVTPEVAVKGAPSSAGPERLAALRHDRWLAASPKRRAELLAAIVADLGPAYALRDGQVAHVATGATFALVPGGRFVMGLSDAEEAHLREPFEDTDRDDAEFVEHFLAEGLGPTRPTRTVDVAPFLLATRPLSRKALKGLGLAPDDSLDTVAPGAVSKLRAALDAATLRLPSDAEREYAARAGTSTLFVGSDDVPTSPAQPANSLGLERLGELPELCADGWCPSHAGAPDDARPRAGKGGVTRGGAGTSWPWQGCGEWIDLLLAYRAPLAAAEFFVASRPAVSLAPDEVAWSEAARADRAAGGLWSVPTGAAAVASPPRAAAPDAPLPDDRFVGLDDIDWSALKSNSGPARRVAAWLRALDGDGLENLETALVGDGRHWPAAAAAAPFVVRLAVRPSSPFRSRWLDLLARAITAGGLAFPATGLQADAAFAAGPGAALLRAIDGATVARLLGDPDPAVRVAAAGLAGLLGDQADTLVRSLSAAFLLSRDEATRAAAATAIGRLASSPVAGKPLDVLRAHVGPAEFPRVRGAAALGLVAHGDLSALGEARRALQIDGFDLFHDRSFAKFAAGVLERSGAAGREALVDELVDACVRAAERWTRGDRSSTPVAQWLARALDMLFPDKKPPAVLDATARWALVRLSAQDIPIGGVFRGYGLEESARDRRVRLRLEPEPAILSRLERDPRSLGARLAADGDFSPQDWKKLDNIRLPVVGDWCNGRFGFKPGPVQALDAAVAAAAPGMAATWARSMVASYPLG